MTLEEVNNTLKNLILSEFLPGEDGENLTDSTPLVTTGVLDSIASLKLVTLLEETFGISVEGHEIVLENLNTIADMANFVQRKLQ